MIFEMVSSLEICIIYCTAVVWMILLRLRLDVARLSVFGTFGEFGLVGVPVRCAKNSGTLESLSDLGKLTVGDFFDPRFKTRHFDLTDVQNIFIARFHKLRAMCKGVLSDLNRKKCQDRCTPAGLMTRCVPDRCLINVWESVRLIDKSFYRDNYFNNPQRWPYHSRRFGKYITEQKISLFCKKMLTCI
jgi:hypothetical protein